MELWQVNGIYNFEMLDIPKFYRWHYLYFQQDEASPFNSNAVRGHLTGTFNKNFIGRQVSLNKKLRWREVRWLKLPPNWSMFAILVTNGLFCLGSLEEHGLHSWQTSKLRGTWRLDKESHQGNYSDSTSACYAVMLRKIQVDFKYLLF